MLVAVCPKPYAVALYAKFRASPLLEFQYVQRSLPNLPSPLVALANMPPIKISVKPTAGGDKIVTDVEPEATILEVKEQLAPQCNIPAAEQRLIYKGQILKDERTVDSYGTQCLQGALGGLTASAKWSVCMQVLATITSCIWFEADLPVQRPGRYLYWGCRMLSMSRPYCNLCNACSSGAGSASNSAAAATGPGSTAAAAAAPSAMDPFGVSGQLHSAHDTQLV